ncbi:MAG: hypothetical protein MRZ79_12795 [Bacteroidia bacterium]|nr:hypothetical protein [Bacteroidia bacterium]
MRSWKIWVILLLLVGGLLWYFWPRPSGVLYEYIPEGTLVVASINGTAIGKQIAKAKLGDGERFDQLLEKAEEVFGVEFGGGEDNSGLGILDLWESPLFMYGTELGQGSLLLAVKDSAGLEELLTRRFEEIPQLAEGYRYLRTETSELALAWNAEALLILPIKGREVFKNDLDIVFKNPGSSTFSSKKRDLRKNSEVFAWIDVQYLSLDTSYFKDAWIEAHLTNDGLQVKLDLEGKDGIDLSSWAKGRLFREAQGSEFPASFHFSIDPLKFYDYLQFDDQLGYENSVLYRWMKMLEGNVALAVLDTGSRVSSLITYEYDDNFERIPVQKSIRKKTINWIASLQSIDLENTKVCLDSLVETGFIQRKGSHMALVDLLDQEVFVKLIELAERDGKEVNESHVIYEPDTVSYINEYLNLISELSIEPGKWIQGRVDKEFWPLLATVYGQEWQKLEGLQVLIEGTADRDKISLMVDVLSPTDNSPFMKLGEILLN